MIATTAAQPSNGLTTPTDVSRRNGNCSTRAGISFSCYNDRAHQNLRVILRFLSQARVRAPISAAISVGQVAQLVEHMTENHGVGGSIPSLATTRLGRLLPSRTAIR